MEKHLRGDDENAVVSLERAGTNGCGRNGLRSLLKIDTGKWNCACRGAMSIKVQRGLPSICEKLINTKVIFIRSPSCCYSYIASRDWNKKSHIGHAFANLGMACIFWVTDANTKTNTSSYQKHWIDWFPMTSITTDMTMPTATCHMTVAEYQWQAYCTFVV